MNSATIDNEIFQKMIKDICRETIIQCKTCPEHTEEPKKRERKQREKKQRSESQIARDKERMADLRSKRLAKKSNDAPQ